MNNQPAEITIKACLLGIILSMVLAGANAYLGLFAGMTVSASIPAAVISMGILSFFRNSNILENNIVFLIHVNIARNSRWGKMQRERPSSLCRDVIYLSCTIIIVNVSNTTIIVSA